MWPLSYGVLAELVGEFLGNSTYLESPSLSLALAAYMTSPPVSAFNMGVVDGPSISRARFEFILPLLMAAGVAV